MMRMILTERVIKRLLGIEVVVISADRPAKAIEKAMICRVNGILVPVVFLGAYTATQIQNTDLGILVRNRSPQYAYFQLPLKKEDLERIRKLQPLRDYLVARRHFLEYSTIDGLIRILKHDLKNALLNGNQEEIIKLVTTIVDFLNSKGYNILTMDPEELLEWIDGWSQDPDHR